MVTLCLLVPDLLMYILLASGLAKVNRAKANTSDVPPKDVLKLHEVLKHRTPCIPVKAAHPAKMPPKSLVHFLLPYHSMSLSSRLAD